MSGRVTLALAATIAASACSAYTPVTMATVPSRGAVRLFLTDAGRSERLGALGSEVTSVEGEVKSIGDCFFDNLPQTRQRRELVPIQRDKFPRSIDPINRTHYQLAKV